MPPKRKRDDSDDDEPSFGRQILPVANLPEDFQDEPIDGLQYLFTVRRDARYLPHVTRAPNPYESTEPPPPPPRYDTSSTTHPALPSEEWRTSFLTHYRNFRKNISQPTINVAFAPQNANHRLMPDKRERDLWWAFIAGRPESDWNPPKKVKQSSTPCKRNFEQGMRSFANDRDPSEDPTPPQETWHINDEGEVELALRVDPTESLPTPTGSPVPQDLSTMETGTSGPSRLMQSEFTLPAWAPREPTPTLLRYIDQRMALHLLMYFTYWINFHLQQKELPSSCLTETHARWIFVLMTKVEDHISADDMSLLRNLARACLALMKELIHKRSSLANTEDAEGDGNEEVARVNDELMGERSCWIIVSVVVGVWGQRDLWLDAEVMLSSLQPLFHPAIRQFNHSTTTRADFAGLGSRHLCLDRVAKILAYHIENALSGQVDEIVDNDLCQIYTLRGSIERYDHTMDRFEDDLILQVFSANLEHCR